MDPLKTLAVGANTTVPLTVGPVGAFPPAPGLAPLLPQCLLPFASQPVAPLGPVGRAFELAVG